MRRGQFFWVVFPLICLLVLTACTSTEPVLQAEKVQLYPAQMTVDGEARWGYIDQHGKFVIQPKFSYADDFRENGLAVVGVGEHFALINTQGNYLAEPEYNWITPFEAGLASLRGPETSTVINEQGQALFTKEGIVEAFNDGMAVWGAPDATGEWLYGYVDLHGETVIERQFAWASGFHNGLARVKLAEGGYAVIDVTGNVVRKLEYEVIGELGDGLMAFQKTADAKSGYIDIDGNIMIPPQFSEAMPFQYGLAVVSKTENWLKSYGVIDTTGTMILEPKYSEIRILRAGMMAVGKWIEPAYPEKGSVFALADGQGRFLTDFTYYQVYDFTGDFLAVSDREMSYLLDADGKRIEDLPVVEGNGELKVMGDLIKANVDAKVYYLDRAGKVVWEPISDQVLGNRLVVKEAKYQPNRNILVYYPQIQGMEDLEREETLNQRLQGIATLVTASKEANLDYHHQAGYRVAFFAGNLLVLEMWSYHYPFRAAHGMPSQDHLHINIRTGEFYHLKDLFKSDADYVTRLSAIIKGQIDEYGEEIGVFVDGFAGIREDHPFTITGEALQIYFTPYEIAPYAAGFPTFEIPYSEIMELIDMEGRLWKAFH